ELKLTELRLVDHIDGYAPVMRMRGKHLGFRFITVAYRQCHAGPVSLLPWNLMERDASGPGERDASGPGEREHSVASCRRRSMDMHDCSGCGQQLSFPSRRFRPAGHQNRL